jgi:hypothetical protein
MQSSYPGICEPHTHTYMHDIHNAIYCEQLCFDFNRAIVYDRNCNLRSLYTFIRRRISRDQA